MRFFAALLCLLLSCPALATELWSGARSGMTVDEVAALFPAATRPAKPGTYANGSANELTAPGPTLSGHRFRVEFTFLHGKLTDVRLFLDEKRTFDEIGPLVHEIRQGLTIKYGAPMSWEDQLKGVVQKYDGAWRHDGMLIEVGAYAVVDNPATVQVRYYRPASTGSL